MNLFNDGAAGDRAHFAWQYTRISDYKKDVAKYANGAIVLEGTDAIPKLRTLSQCEEVLGEAAFGANMKVLRLYGHNSTAGARSSRIVPSTPGVVWIPAKSEPSDGSTFLALNMGQWVRSHEVKVEGKSMYECTGALRPGFEVALDAALKQLKPSNRADGNPLAFFTNKVLHLKAKGMVAL